MSIIEIRQHLYRLVLGRYQANLWHDGGSTTLIDSGEPGSGPMIAEALGTLGLGPERIDRLVLTHFHDDHVGSAAEVAGWGDVEVIAHEADTPIIRGNEPGPAPNFTDWERNLHAIVAQDLAPAPPVRVDRLVHDGDLIDFADGATVVSTPGHTDGSMALHLPQHRVLITGDIAAEHDGQVMLGPFNVDCDQAAGSFRRLADLDADTICFGHGEPIVTGGTERLQQVAASLATADDHDRR